MKIAIIGAGMAGLYLCEYLHKEADITVFHNEQSDMASGGQSFLFHPFPGRSLEILPHLQEAVQDTTALLESWKQRFPTHIRRQPMLRPLTGTNGSRLEKSYLKWWKNTSETWAQFTEHPEETTTQNIINSFPRAISYSPAFVVDFSELRPALIAHYKEQGIRFLSRTVKEIHAQDSLWNIDGSLSAFDRVILALGSQTPYWFPDLKLTTQGGSLLRLQMSEPLSYLFSLDGLHVGTHQSGDWVAGSTRWKNQPDPCTEIQVIKEKIRKQFPNQRQGKVHSLWSGNRCIYPADRMPLCGELPHQKGIHVLTALGSKGMLWGPFSAKHLVLSMLKYQPLPEEIDLLRANQEDGWFSERIQ